MYYERSMKGSMRTKYIIRTPERADQQFNDLQDAIQAAKDHFTDGYEGPVQLLATIDEWYTMAAGTLIPIN